MDMLVVPLLILVALLFVFIKLKTPSARLPPGPNTWQVLRRLSELQNEPHVAFRNLAKVYGPIMSLRVGSQVVVVASSSATAKEILRTHDRSFSGRWLPALYYTVPSAEQSSLTMSKDCNDTWKLLRGIGQSSIFSSRSIDSRADMRKAKAVDMVRYWRTRCGEVVKLDNVVKSVFYNIISDTLVSRELFDIRRDDGKDESVRRVVEEITAMSSSLGFSDLFPFLRVVDLPTKRKAMEFYRNIVSIWGDVVRERRSQGARRGASKAESSDRDFLGALLDSTLTDDQICLTLMEVMVAATDSSSLTSMWLMTELIKNPHIMHKLRDDISKAFEGDEDDHDCITINESILNESKYLQACVKEALRVHISGPFLIPHRSVETCKIGSYMIPKDSMVIVNAWAIGLEPQSWEDADVFNPDRFLDSEIDFRGTHFEFIPFSAGRRMCPGFNVASKNIQIVVASLMHYFDWSLPDGADPTQIDMAAVFKTILKKKKPLHLIPSLRN